MRAAILTDPSAAQHDGMARALNVAPRTLYRLRERFQVPWPPFDDWAALLTLAGATEGPERELPETTWLITYTAARAALGLGTHHRRGDRQIAHRARVTRRDSGHPARLSCRHHHLSVYCRDRPATVSPSVLTLALAAAEARQILTGMSPDEPIRHEPAPQRRPRVAALPYRVVQETYGLDRRAAVDVLYDLVTEAWALKRSQDVAR